MVPMSLIHDSRHGPSVPPPPPPLDGAEGAGGTLSHESLAALEDQHKQMLADDGSVLSDQGQGSMQVLGIDQVSGSNMASDAMHIPPGHGIKLDPSSTSPSAKMLRPASQDAAVGAPGVADACLGAAVDVATSSLPPLRLCAHGKPTGECADCLKITSAPVSPTHGAALHEGAKKRRRDDDCVAPGCKVDGADVAGMLKSPAIVVASGVAGDLVASNPSDGLVCEHNRLRSHCECCGVCRHGKMKNKCKECVVCAAHGRLRHDCRDCNAGSRRWCPHNKRKHDCKECSGCPHNRVKRCCRDCNGSAVCPHQRLRKNCRECKVAPPQ